MAEPVDNPSPLPAESVEPATEPADEPPAARCPEHLHDEQAPNCGRCKAHRMERQAWQERVARDVAAARRAELIERNQAEADEIAACGLCDDDGFTAPAVKCLHDPNAVRTARRGAAACRAALAEAQARRNPEPQPAPADSPTTHTAPVPAARR